MKTRVLLTGGILAGPLYVVSSLVQAMVEDGFDLTRHAWSLLSLGDLGWLHIATFLLVGAAVVGLGVGIGRASGDDRTRWAAWLLGGYGLALVASGVFVADPVDDFPTSAPAGAGEVSWHGMLHFVAGAIGFLCLIAVCIGFAVRFARRGRRTAAAISAIVGIGFLLAFGGIASGPGSTVTVLGFTAAVIASWAWISWLAIDISRRSVV